MLTWILLGGGGLFAVGCLVAIALVIVFAFFKKRIDLRQEDFSEFGVLLEQKLHLDGAKPFFMKFGSGNFIGAAKFAVSWVREWIKPGKVNLLVARIIRKSLPAIVKVEDLEVRIQVAEAMAKALPTVLDDKDVEKILEKVLMERIIGKTLDPQTKAEMAILSGPLAEWGLDKTSAAILGVATDNADIARLQIKAAVAELSTEEGRRAAAKRVLRKLLPEFAEVPADRLLALEWLGGVPAPK